jgi:hypothetical protein
MANFEPEAEIVRAILAAHADDGDSIRQIAHDRIPPPTGKPIWGTSTLHRLHAKRGLHRARPLQPPRDDQSSRRAARRAADQMRCRGRPREDWITIPAPTIIDPDTFEHAQPVSRESPKWSPRGIEPGHWLPRGLIECGHCHVGCNCHRMRGRNGTFHRSYHCRTTTSCAPAANTCVAANATSAPTNSTPTSPKSAARCSTRRTSSPASAPSAPPPHPPTTSSSWRSASHA